MKNYAIHSADAICKDIAAVPECAGLYAFMLKDPAVLAPALDRAGLVMDVMGLGQAPLLYVGASGDSLRRRLACHLRDDTQGSTFRQSLGALLAEELSLTIRPVPSRHVFGFIPADEARLTRWMRDHLQVALRPAMRPAALERRAIADQDPLLNITGRRAHDTAWTLLLLRRKCVEQACAGEQAFA